MIRRVICSILAIGLALAMTAGSAAAEEDEVEKILSSMSLKDKIGQMMIVAYRIWKEVPDETPETVENTEQEIPAVNVTELNEEIRASLAGNRFGGIILYAENCQDAEQMLRLVTEMQQVNQEAGGLPLLMSIDQEGGSVSRLTFGTTGTGSMALAATGDPENARAMASVFGRELKLLGVNTDFAPVMDVNSDPANPVIGVRAFSDDPETVAAFGSAYMAGLQENGVIATLKHFPGHGDTDTDSHTGFPSISSTYDELKAFELVPFQAMIDAGADMIMTAHIQYPEIEPEKLVSVTTGEEVYLPATMSRTILTDILRKDMGFEGVVVSDALDMGAIKDNFSDADVLARAINAGADMLLLPAVKDTTLFRHLQEMVDLAVELAESGKIDPARVDESVRRILKLKQKYGLLAAGDYTLTEEQIRAAVEGTGSEEHRGIERDIAEKALTLVKNDNNAFPAALKAGDKVFFLFADSCASRVGTGEMVKEILTEKGFLPEGTEITAMAHTRENDEECLKAAEEADHVILVHRVYSAACLDPATGDGFSSAMFDRIIARLHELNRTVILVSCQLPYDAGRFPEADAILLTYGSSVMRALPPKTGAGSAFQANLPEALCACLGDGTAEGRLPVNLPVIDAEYRITEEIWKTREIGN